MNLPDDDDLRARFEALREEDRRRAPAFRGALSDERPRPLSRTRAFPLVWIAAAAGILLTVGIAVRETRQHGRDPYAGSASSFRGGDTASITAWKSPTASLLRNSGSEMLASSRILSSVLDGASRAAVQH
jgi:hypothetical protein